ncbi:MAG: hypothetical protein O2931_01610, partial [Planctomycetota bacterium]|nr:hypothetical protein [Planctomycetota bacterium]
RLHSPVHRTGYEEIRKPLGPTARPFVAPDDRNNFPGPTTIHQSPASLRGLVLKYATRQRPVVHYLKAEARQ